MKRLLSVIIILVMVLSITALGANAGSASIGLSGPSSAESGSSITFSATASSSAGLTSFAASINAGDGLVVESVSGCPGGWQNQSTNNKIVVAGSSAVNSIEVTIKCKITGDVGASKTLSISGISTSDADGNDDVSYGTVSKSVTVDPPKSGENRLASLSVAGKTLSPKFSPDTTTYTVDKVDFDTKSLSVSATCKDSSATYTITGTSLVVGANNIRINVTAPNGSTKTYTIKVEREQDPNYKAESDGALSELTVSEGTLSPAFDPKVKEYVVYLPYEIEKISATGKAKSALSKGVENVKDQALKVGKNEVKVVCTAEDDSKTTYTIYVVRMDEFGKVDDLGLPASLSGTKTETTTTPQETETKSGFSPVIAVIMALVCLVFGVGIGALIFRGKVKDFDDPDGDSQEGIASLFEPETPKIVIPGFEKYVLDDATEEPPVKKKPKAKKPPVEPEVEEEPVVEEPKPKKKAKPASTNEAPKKKKAPAKKAPAKDEYEDISSSSNRVKYKTYEDYLNEMEDK